MRTKRPIIFILLAFFLVSGVLFHGCASTKGLDTHQSNLLKFYSAYNLQYRIYQQQTAHPSTLSTEKVKVLRQKREALVKLREMIYAYETALRLGNADVTVIEQQIFDLLVNFE